MPDVSWSRGDDDDRRGAHRSATVQRPSEPGRPAPGRAASHHGLVRGMSSTGKHDTRRSRPARLRHVPSLMMEPTRAKPHVPIARSDRRRSNHGSSLNRRDERSHAHPSVAAIAGRPIHGELLNRENERSPACLLLSPTVQADLVDRKRSDEGKHAHPSVAAIAGRPIHGELLNREKEPSPACLLLAPTLQAALASLNRRDERSHAHPSVAAIAGRPIHGELLNRENERSPACLLLSPTVEADL